MLCLLRCQELVWVLLIILATDSQPSAWKAIEEFHSKHTVVVKGIYLTIFDMRSTPVNTDSGAVHDQALHAPTSEGRTRSVLLVNPCLAKR